MLKIQQRNPSQFQPKWCIMIENTYSEIENYALGIRKTEVLAADESPRDLINGSDKDGGKG